MPNTLGHLGLQALLTARLGRDVRLDDLRWVALGCILPDLPWIARRVALVLAPGIDESSLRAYAIAQSSLLVSLVLAAAFTCIAAQPRRAGLLLSANVTLHLVLDALQTKWGNGVLLIAPLDFEPMNIGLFWPESGMTLVLTACGLGLLVLGFRGPAAPAGSLFCFSSVQPLRPLRVGAAAVLVAIWVAAPLCWVDDVFDADAHGLQTLTLGQERSGRACAFDRSPVEVDSQGVAWIELAHGERIRCTGVCPEITGAYSLRGRFESQDVFRAEASHRHRAGLRDAASYVGLMGVVALWGRGARGGVRQRAG